MNEKRISYNLIFVTLISIIVAVFLDFSLVFSFVGSIFYALIVLNFKGYDVRTLIKSSFLEAIKYKNLYLTILFIGATVAMWLSSGTIATIIYYGFNYISGINFLLFSFVAVSVCSLFMGTALGTFSTIGLILFSIGNVINIPAPMLVGAIISGAFVSDKLSPISGLVNINLKISEVRYNDTLKYVIRTLAPSFLITMLIYYILGNEYIIYGKTQNLINIQNQLQDSFSIQPLLLAFPVFILILSVFGINPLYIIMIGVILGGAFSYFVQGFSMAKIFSFLFWGFRLNPSDSLFSLLKGGGILHIVEVMIVVSSAVFLVSIFMRSGVIDILIGGFIQSINTPRKLLQKTGLMSIAITILTCDQTVGLVLPGTVLKSKYDDFGIQREILFRTLSDTGTVVAPLFPWNINYLVIVSIIGANIHFIPFTCFCYITPLISLLSSYFYSNKKMDENGQDKQDKIVSKID